MFVGMTAGAVVLAGVTLLFDVGGALGPMVWISSSTLGLMMMYTPTGSFLYDRLIAATATEGSVSFLVFLSDGLGYIAVRGKSGK